MHTHTHTHTHTQSHTHSVYLMLRTLLEISERRASLANTLMEYDSDTDLSEVLPRTLEGLSLVPRLSPRANEKWKGKGRAWQNLSRDKRHR